MNLLFYAPVMNREGRQLYRMIEKLNPRMGLELHRSNVSLAQRLRLPLRGIPIAVLYLTRKEDLTDILSIKDLLGDIRIILSLPDREDETVSKGHILRPSFLVYPDSELRDVTEVLKKMLSREIFIDRFEEQRI
jgi:hypothetical protein